MTLPAVKTRTSIPVVSLPPLRKLVLGLGIFVVFFGGWINWESIDATILIKKQAAVPKRVLCLGDSLTAGLAPPERDRYPYSMFLERALVPLMPQEADKATILTRGNPGWTSSRIANDAFLTGFLNEARTRKKEELKRSHNHKHAIVDLVIVLAGTNDLEEHGLTSESIFESIKGIHDQIVSSGCPTIAMGIPPSGFQTSSEDIRNKARSVNQMLQEWAETTSTTVYVPFPIEKYEISSGRWSIDRLHLTKLGYEKVGKSLAFLVAKILWSGDQR